MNPAHLHILLNHGPVIGTVIGIFLLILAIFMKSRDVARSAFAVLLLSALAAIPVYLTGEPAEEIVEHLPGVSRAAVHDHEEAAETAFIAIEILGVAALASLIAARRGERVHPAALGVTLVIALGTAGLMAWTANLGGQIRHPEIRSGGAQQSPSDAPERRGDDD